MTVACPDLPDVTPADMGELLEMSIETNTIYRRCAARHKALAEWAKR